MLYELFKAKFLQNSFKNYIFLTKLYTKILFFLTISQKPGKGTRFVIHRLHLQDPCENLAYPLPCPFTRFLRYLSLNFLKIIKMLKNYADFLHILPKKLVFYVLQIDFLKLGHLQCTLRKSKEGLII